jgi:hypothetical protein
VKRVPLALFLLGLSLLALGCKQPETQLRLQFPSDPDAGADAGGCQQQTSLRCVNYLQFTAGSGNFSSTCSKVGVVLEDLCDVAKLAVGQEVFKLSPDTPLPITLEGLRVFPATSCNANECPARRIFSGTTSGTGKIGDYAGGVLDIPVTVNEPCGLPEEFFFLPAGSTCADLCGAGNVVCDQVQGGCLCKGLPSAADLAARQGAVDGGQ